MRLWTLPLVFLLLAIGSQRAFAAEHQKSSETLASAFAKSRS